MNNYHNLRLRWKKILIGEEIDLNNSHIRKAVEDRDKEVENLWSSMNKSEERKALWEDLNREGTSEILTHNYIRLRKMALCHETEGSKYFKNPQLLEDIKDGLDWMYENKYNEHCNYYDNWWPWDIGAPKNLNDTVVLIYEDLNEAQIDKYMKAIERFVSDPRYNGAVKRISTGANRVDLVKIAVLKGIILKDCNKIKNAVDALSEVFKYVDAHDGFYKDGSFIQHGNIPYTCSYGWVLLDGLSYMINLLQESPWEIKDPEANNIYAWIFDSYEPLIFKGLAMDMVRGRGMSRHFLQDFKAGHNIIESIARLYERANEEYKERLKGIVIHSLSNELVEEFFKDRDIYSINLINKILKEADINSGKLEVPMHKNFAMMDRVVHRGKDYAFAISMYSKRIQNYEYMNSENKKGFYTSDGMTYLYNNDLHQYNDNFWPTVNPYRIPGTTVDTAEREIPKEHNCTSCQRTSTKAWVGGVTLDGVYGTAGMELESGFSSLEAKKSWFMFDKEIASLGSDINANDNREIETIIENRKLNVKGNNSLIADGEKQSVGLDGEVKSKEVRWAYLEGNSEGADIGYYFPGKAKMNFLREKRQGSWKEINASEPDTVVENNFINLWINHGMNPKNEKYSYVILPGMNVEEVEAYVSCPNIDILENSSKIHAVWHKKLNILAANFWTEEESKVDFITCFNKVSIMAKVQEEYLEIAVSDPTMENEDVISILVDIPLKEVITKDEKVKIEPLEKGFKINIGVKDAKGQTYSMKVKI